MLKSGHHTNRVRLEKKKREKDVRTHAVDEITDIKVGEIFSSLKNKNFDLYS